MIPGKTPFCIRESWQTAPEVVQLAHILKEMGRF
jgi:hypothetical protein